MTRSDLARFREQFPVAGRMAYFANGSVGPATTPVVEASREWLTEWTLDPQPAYRSYHARREHLRSSVAAMLGCDPDEVALTENASRGAHLAVRLLAGRPGGHVLVDDSTYPSSRYAWLVWSEKRLRHVDDDGQTAALAEAVDADTAAISISHVDWATGVRHEVQLLSEAAHRHGAVLVVDGSQSVGAVPVRVREHGIDVLVGTFGKWLLGGPGLGFLYVRRDLLNDDVCLEPGWNSLAPNDTDWPVERMPKSVGTARSFEPATPNLHGIVTAQAGLDLVTGAGIDMIGAAIGERAGQIRSGLVELGVEPLTPEPAERRAGLIAFRHHRAPAVASFLRDRGVEITGYPFSLVRIDPHAYNVASEVEKMLGLLRQALVACS